MNGGIRLLILVSAARHPKAQAYFRYFALLVVGWAIFLDGCFNFISIYHHLDSNLFLLFLFLFLVTSATG